MARGKAKATPGGEKGDGTVLKDLQVGIYKKDTASDDIDAAFDDLLSHPPAKPRDIFKKLHDPLDAKYSFPKDVHYMIAREGFLERLKGANLTG